METLSTIWTIFVVLLGLALGIALIYVGLAAIGFVLSLPFLIAGGILGFVGGILGILLMILKEGVLSLGRRLGHLLGLRTNVHSRRRESDYRQSTQENGGSHRQRRQSTEGSVFDPYLVLQVTRGATLTEIRTAYYQQMSQYHPDKVAHLGEELQALAEEKAKSIQRAYSALRYV